MYSAHEAGVHRARHDADRRQAHGGGVRRDARVPAPHAGVGRGDGLGPRRRRRERHARRGVAAAVESAKLSRFADADIPAIDLATPIGAIVLRGKGVDHHGAKEDGAALVVDTGGDDVYTGAIGASRKGVSIAIDLGGSDRYAYD